MFARSGRSALVVAASLCLDHCRVPGVTIFWPLYHPAVLARWLRSVWTSRSLGLCSRSSADPSPCSKLPKTCVVAVVGVAVALDLVEAVEAD